MSSLLWLWLCLPIVNDSSSKHGSRNTKIEQTYSNVRSIIIKERRCRLLSLRVSLIYEQGLMSWSIFTPDQIWVKDVFVDESCILASERGKRVTDDTSPTRKDNDRLGSRHDASPVLIGVYCLLLDWDSNSLNGFRYAGCSWPGSSRKCAQTEAADTRQEGTTESAPPEPSEAVTDYLVRKTEYLLYRFV